MFNPLSPTTRQTTRALQEIQSQRPNLLVVQEDLEGLGGEIIQLTQVPMQPVDITDRMRWSTNLLAGDSFTTPSPSPDEMVIQARGRRTVPLTYSPDINHTPVRQQQRNMTVSGLAQSPTRPSSSHISRLLLPPSSARSSPRKRLTLSDTPPHQTGQPNITSSLYSPSPDKLRRSPLAKKLRLDPSCLVSVEPETAARGLSHGQLVGIVSGLLERHPELRQEVSDMMPTPDLVCHEESLNYLKRNIYKALPSTRLESKTDSMAYNRVSVHLMAFKKALGEGLKSLLEAQQWLSAIDYTVMAWGYVKDTPVWANHPHNTVRKACFKTLATGCMRAIREGNFGSGECQTIKNKLDKLKSESDEILVCIKYIDFIMTTNTIIE